MKDERKAVSVKLTPEATDAIDAWMSESSCSRQVAMLGLIVQGAKKMGVWIGEPRERATNSVSVPLTNNVCSTYDEGTSTRRVSATTETDDQLVAFSQFWGYLGREKRGNREEAKKKWCSKKLRKELSKSGLTPTDVAQRYVAYFKANKGEGYDGSKYCKHVVNWLDSFGFNDDVPTVVEQGRNKVDRDLDEEVWS